MVHTTLGVTPAGLVPADGPGGQATGTSTGTLGAAASTTPRPPTTGTGVAFAVSTAGADAASLSPRDASARGGLSRTGHSSDDSRDAPPGSPSATAPDGRSLGRMLGAPQPSSRPSSSLRPTGNAGGMQQAYGGSGGPSGHDATGRPRSRPTSHTSVKGGEGGGGRRGARGALKDAAPSGPRKIAMDGLGDALNKFYQARVLWAGVLGSYKTRAFAAAAPCGALAGCAGGSATTGKAVAPPARFAGPHKPAPPPAPSPVACLSPSFHLTLCMSVVLINECPLNARLETGVGLSFFPST
jgi:hypothetical protein